MATDKATSGASIIGERLRHKCKKVGDEAMYSRTAAKPKQEAAEEKVRVHAYSLS